MRTAATAASLLLVLTACSTTQPAATSQFEQPNPLMAGEINRRIDQIPFLHREELLENLLWLAQTGEKTIPALFVALENDNAKVRSSAAWVLGRLRDRRTIPQLQAAVADTEPTVRLECARTLVLLGDLAPAPVLIDGLDSDRKEVRYLCHEALKASTGHDFGYDHLAADVTELRGSVLRWRQWWSDYSGDKMYAMGYAAKHGLNAEQPAAPSGEIKLSAPKTPAVPKSEAPMPVTPKSDAGNQAPPSSVDDGIEVVEVPNPKADKTNKSNSDNAGKSKNDSSKSDSPKSGATGVIEIGSSPMPTTDKPAAVPVVEIQMEPMPASPTTTPSSKPVSTPASKPNSQPNGSASGTGRHQ